MDTGRNRPLGEGKSKGGRRRGAPGCTEPPLGPSLGLVDLAAFCPATWVQVRCRCGAGAEPVAVRVTVLPGKEANPGVSNAKDGVTSQGVCFVLQKRVRETERQTDRSDSL